MSIIFGVAFSKVSGIVVLVILAVICVAYAAVQFTSFGDDIPRWGDE